MIISTIKQNSPSSLSVILEDGEEIKTTLGVVTDLRLFSGRDLDEAALEALRLESRRALARDRALAIVSQRQMSRRELGGKLRDKGVDEETAAWCVDWITEHGFIDEEAYAAAIARHYAAKGYGEGRVRQELMRRGIPRELFDDAFAAMPEGDEKLDRFIAARLRDPDDRDEVRKLSAALYRRGYSGEEIREALRRHKAELYED